MQRCAGMQHKAESSTACQVSLDMGNSCGWIPDCPSLAQRMQHNRNHTQVAVCCVCAHDMLLLLGVALGWKALHQQQEHIMCTNAIKHKLLLPPCARCRADAVCCCRLKSALWAVVRLVSLSQAGHAAVLLHVLLFACLSRGVELHVVQAASAGTLPGILFVQLLLESVKHFLCKVCFGLG
jgi:hypothetical protein